MSSSRLVRKKMKVPRSSLAVLDSLNRNVCVVMGFVVDAYLKTDQDLSYKRTRRYSFSLLRLVKCVQLTQQVAKSLLYSCPPQV